MACASLLMVSSSRTARESHADGDTDQIGRLSLSVLFLDDDALVLLDQLAIRWWQRCQKLGLDLCGALRKTRVDLPHESVVLHAGGVDQFVDVERPFRDVVLSELGCSLERRMESARFQCPLCCFVGGLLR